MICDLLLSERQALFASMSVIVAGHAQCEAAVAVRTRPGRTSGLTVVWSLPSRRCHGGTHGRAVSDDHPDAQVPRRPLDPYSLLSRYGDLPAA